jgi:hypothetical protein
MPPEFVGRQYQNKSSLQIEKFSRMKIHQVVYDIVFNIMVPKRSSKSPVVQGDDLFTLIMSDSKLEHFMNDLEQIVWRNIQ